jgi:hypothetical protein
MTGKTDDDLPFAGNWGHGRKRLCSLVWIGLDTVATAVSMRYYTAASSSPNEETSCTANKVH